MKLNLNKGRRGGRRLNSGRKRKKSQGVAHRVRRRISKSTPMHINFKYRMNVRNKETLKLLKKSISNARRHGLKVLHYSFQSNHVHLILEAESNEILTRGMRSLTITFAKGLQKGRVQLERYHLHILKSLRETKNAIHYVLFNQQKHEKGICSRIDEYSSVLCFEGGLNLVREFAKRNRMTITIGKVSWIPDPPRSWLAQNGIKKGEP